MKDRFGREITNIRISITQRCNLECFYCHEEGENGLNKGVLSLEDLEPILKTAEKLGMSKVKFSGGEPLVHPDIVEIISLANDYMDEISLTTNGILLPELAEQLKNAGLDRVNISLDTLDKETYERLTYYDKLDKVKEGIRKAVDTGLFPIKINMLLMAGINDDEVEDMIEFSASSGAILQVIEMTSSVENIDEDTFSKYHKPLGELAKELEDRAIEVKERKMHSRKKYFLDEPETQVELVRTMHNTQFCDNCTRLRVTSTAELKPCLLRTDNHISIREDIDKGSPLKEKFIEAIYNREPYWRD